MNNMIRRCSVEGCEREHAARGYCRAQWKRWKRYGDPLGAFTPTPKEPVFCLAQNCPKPVQAKGLCAMHYYRVHTLGSLDLPPHQAKYDPLCTVEGCTKPAQSRGWCAKHYKRWEQHGTTDDPVRPPP